MNTAFPPRASRTLGTSSQENASSALVSTSKDSAAASPGFSINRPPLDSLGMNGTGMGLRQRRHDLNGSSSQLPPRESLTMMGASKASSSSTPTTATAASHSNEYAVTVPSAEEYWVLVYGFSQHQREEVLSLFRQVGDVAEVRTGSRDSNWAAISYESALAVEQALIKGGNRLSNGHIFGVQRLRDSRKFFMEEAKYGAVMATSHSDDLSLSRGLFPTDTPAGDTNNDSKNNDNAKKLAEEDILMTPNKDGSTGKHKNVCELFMAWVYGW